MITERNVVNQAGFQVKVIPPNQQAFTLGFGPMGVGAVGDRLQRLVLNIGQPAAANVTLLDGWSEIPILVPGAAVSPGPLVVELGAYSSIGPWSVRMGAGVTGIAVGVFSA